MVVFAQPTDLVRINRSTDPASSLDFRFDGIKYGDIYGRFSVGILGLSTEKIFELTTWNIAKSVRNRRKIRVYAGYESDFTEGANVSPIFDGFVLSAMPTNPPEMWMNFDCIRYYETNQPVAEPKVVNGTLSNILSVIAGYTNTEWSERRWHATQVESTQDGSFEISGSKTMLIHKFAAKFRLNIVTNRATSEKKSGALDVYDARPWIYSPVSVSDTIKTENGLLALGNVDMKGAKLTIRLSDRHKLCDWIRLESRLIPCANDPYIVISKHLKGHLRGQEWQTELECVRRGALI